jgi:hypothetical protein
MKKLTSTIIICLISALALFSQDKPQTETEKLSQEIMTLYQQRKFDDAIKKAKKLVEIEKKTSETSESYADAITTLANLQTEKLRIQVIKGLENQSTDRELETKRRTAWFSENNELGGKTEDLFREALKIYNKPIDNETTQTATIKGQLAWILIHFRGNKIITLDNVRPRIDEEELLYMQAIASHEKLLGKNNDLTLRTYIEFADFYLIYVNFEKALPLYEIYQTEVEKKFGKDSKQLLKCLRPLAEIMTTTERTTEAAELEQRITKLTGSKEETAKPFNLTRRSKDLLAQLYNGKEIKKGSTIRIDILADETGKIIEAIAKTGSKSDKLKAETATLKFTVRPFIYKNEARRMRGYFYYISD